MVRVTQSLGLIIPFRILLAATIPGSSDPSTLSINPSNDTTPTNQTIYHAPFQYTAPLDAGQEVKCSEEYGIDVDPTSCFDAWQRFRWQDERVFTFGQRGLTPKPQQILPMRISSRELVWAFLFGSERGLLGVACAGAMCACGIYRSEVVSSNRLSQPV